MIRTVVCQKEGCSGNEFLIATLDNNIQATCKECGSKYLFEVKDEGYELTSHCTSCNNGTFKMFRNLDNNKVYAKCTECGNPPEKIYVDLDGVQISYKEKSLQDIKELMNSLDQRLCNLEIKIDDMERGQGILEESLAYINKYIIEER